jgi:hypothetical protein
MGKAAELNAAGEEDERSLLDKAWNKTGAWAREKV